MIIGFLCVECGQNIQTLLKLPFYRFKQMVEYVGAYMVEKNTDPKDKARQEAIDETKGFTNTRDYLMQKAAKNNAKK